MDTVFLTWLAETYGPWAGLVYLLWVFSKKSSDNKQDVVAELFKRLDRIEENAQTANERIARIEGKLDGK